jgi:hypothetical protein
MPTTARPRRAPACWLVATALLLLMFAASAPSPLYVVYQARWHFSSGILTTVFAVYALFLLLAVRALRAVTLGSGRHGRSLIMLVRGQMMFGVHGRHARVRIGRRPPLTK